MTNIQQRMEQMAERVTTARTHLLLDHPWFGTLALRLIVRPSEMAPTIQTDGTYLEYSPEWCSQWSNNQLVGLIAHEVMHCAMIHPYRMAGRDHALWNVACDLAINQLIRATGFELPPGLNDHREGEFADMNAEQIYAKLFEEKQKTGKSPQPDFGEHVKPAKDKQAQKDSVADAAKKTPSNGKPQPQGEKQDGDETGEGEGMTEFDWQIEAEQAAMVARKAGTMPGNVDSALKSTREAKVDWRTVLRRFIENVVPSDYSWTQPNRRHLASGLVMPGMVKENMPPIVFAIDTSGSVSDPMLEQFVGESVTLVREVRPERIIVIQCDARIQSVEEFTPDDFDIVKIKGRGGTRFQPVFDWLMEQDQMPCALIYCTDLEGDHPTDPDIPVLWVVPEWQKQDADFGETIRVAMVE